MLEWGSIRCSVVSLTSAKFLIQFGLMGYFSELGIKGRVWLIIKDLHTNVKEKLLYAGSLSREIDISQGIGQGRILAPFMYKVYINSLLKALTDHCYAISVNSVSLPSP